MKRRIFIAINLPEEIKRRLASCQEKIEELFTPYRNEDSGLGPIRWTKKENLHITLEFLGYISDKELLNTLKNIRELTLKQKPFSITLNKICYGPPKKMPPRMIWIIAAPFCGVSPVRGLQDEEKTQSKQTSNGASPVRGLQDEEKTQSKQTSNGALFERIASSRRPLQSEDQARALPKEREKKNRELEEQILRRPDFSPHITLGRIKTWEWRQIEPEERPVVDEEINLAFEVNSIEVMESVLKREGPEYTILESFKFKK